jgi:pyruvate/2-oxoglutarate dehydrogenase complex dihydrolipoamide acyltransferase (E2) component
MDPLTTCSLRGRIGAMRVPSGVSLVGLALLVGVLGGCGESGDSAETASAPAPESNAKAKAVAKAETARLEERRELAAKRRAKAAKKQRERINREEAQERARGGWTGIDGDNYEIAKASCGAFSKEKLASEYGLPSSADEFEIAEAYSHEFVGRFQQAKL